MSSYFSHNCRACSAPLKKGQSQCPSCKTWNIGPSQVAAKSTVLLSELKSDKHQRLKTGPWDKCFGGGLVLTGLSLIGGARGAGKSTLMMQIAEEICRLYDKENGEILYISTEEAPEELHLRACRLELNYMHRFRVMSSMSEFMNSDILGSVSTNPNKPKAIFFDSLTGTVGDNREAGRELLLQLKNTATDNRIPVLVIDQINKDNDIAGPMTNQHKVDSLYAFVLEGEVRRLVTLKNRHGPAGPSIACEFIMDDIGKLEHIPDCELCGLVLSQCECCEVCNLAVCICKKKQ